MAQTAWVAMTRATAGRQSSKTARTRVDAGVKELNEMMTIGRTDDPENPFGAQAFKAAFVFGFGSRTPSGPATVLPRQQAGHMIAIDPPVRILIFSLASEGPSTHAPRRLRFFSSKQLRARVAVMLEHLGYELLTPETAADLVMREPEPSGLAGAVHL